MFLSLEGGEKLYVAIGNIVNKLLAPSEQHQFNISGKSEKKHFVEELQRLVFGNRLFIEVGFLK